jgi:hypothetical protein
MSREAMKPLAVAAQNAKRKRAQSNLAGPTVWVSWSDDAAVLLPVENGPGTRGLP